MSRSLCFSAPRNHFHTSGAPWRTILAPKDLPGGPWEQQDGLEMVVYRILFDFGVIWGPVYMSFLSSRSFKFCFLGACYQSICLSISESEFPRLGLPNQDFRMECIAQIAFQWKSFPMNFGIDFYFFLEALRAAFPVLWALKIGLK